MKVHRTATTLAEFLDAYADQQAANGNDVNADIWRERAMQAKQQELTLQKAQAALQDAQDRLADIRRTLQIAA